MNESTLLIDLQYFGNSTYYKTLMTGSDVVFEQYENHLKKSYHNRCRIAGANGLITLSVPLQKGRDQKSVLRDIRIFNDGDWQKRHFKSIISSYNCSPWFKFYCDELAEIYSTHFDYLLDWNLACLNWSFGKLKWDLDYSFSTGFMASYEGKEGWRDLRNKIIPGHEAELDRLLRYQQVFEEKTGFIPHLSILDMLFCVGPEKALSGLRQDKTR